MGQRVDTFEHRQLAGEAMHLRAINPARRNTSARHSCGDVAIFLSTVHSPRRQSESITVLRWVLRDTQRVDQRLDAAASLLAAVEEYASQRANGRKENHSNDEPYAQNIRVEYTNETWGVYRRI